MSRFAARAATAVAALLVLALPGCSREGTGTPASDDADDEVVLGPAIDRTLEAIEAAADSVDDALRPIALLGPGESSSLRTYLNRRHLRRARALGARPADGRSVDDLEADGLLVRLADSTDHWVIRELTHSVPWVTPDARALLERVGVRFHERLDSLGAPSYRMELSSLLRTPEQQADLRARNVNATGGTSAHEFGTTVDIAYNGFAAPAEAMVEPDLPEAPWLEAHLARVADGVAERVAARRSRELQAILGRVLREMQAEGLVFVTLERRQPVYHITVADRIAGAA